MTNAPAPDDMESAMLRALRLDECPLDGVGLVVDQYRKRVGLEPQNLAELLELPVLSTLSTQTANRIQAMNQGEPMFACAPKDEYCNGVRQLAASLMSPAKATSATAGESGGGLLGRLFR